MQIEGEQNTVSTIGKLWAQICLGMILEFIEFIRQCSRYYMSKYKNIQVVERRVQIQWNPTNWKS